MPTPRFIFRAAGLLVSAGGLPATLLLTMGVIERHEFAFAFLTHVAAAWIFHFLMQRALAVRY